MITQSRQPPSIRRQGEYRYAVDIEGSTRLLRELGEGYLPAFAEHRRILREAFARHSGVEVGTGGDAFFVVFRSATQAAAAAAEAQAALRPGRIWIA